MKLCFNDGEQVHCVNSEGVLLHAHKAAGNEDDALLSGYIATGLGSENDHEPDLSKPSTVDVRGGTLLSLACKWGCFQLCNAVLSRAMVRHFLSRDVTPIQSTYSVLCGSFSTQV